MCRHGQSKRHMEVWTKQMIFACRVVKLAKLGGSDRHMRHTQRDEQICRQAGFHGLHRIACVQNRRLPSFWLELDRDRISGCLARPLPSVSSILARQGTAASVQSACSSAPKADSRCVGSMPTGDSANGLWQQSWSALEDEVPSPSSLKARAARADSPMKASMSGLKETRPMTGTSSCKAPAVLAAAWHKGSSSAKQINVQMIPCTGQCTPKYVLGHH